MNLQTQKLVHVCAAIPACGLSAEVLSLRCMANLVISGQRSEIEVLGLPLSLCYPPYITGD